MNEQYGPGNDSPSLNHDDVEVEFGPQCKPSADPWTKLPFDYCPFCGITHVTCECPRPDETWKAYQSRMRKGEKHAMG